MRYKVLAVAALLIFTTSGAFAASAADLLKQQRSHINAAITARNALLDRIHFTGHNDDSLQLASINASELTVAYALQALENVIELVRPAARQTNGAGAGAGSLRGVGEPMLTLCQVQMTQMASDSAELVDSRIRDEVQKQIENVRAACGAIGATWSGMGREPLWIKGQSREQFLIRD
ncbi:H-NS family nucleoid-associated regulatory protein [Paraburkholderia sediminicola]|uniref:H-NS family nucleoid-associated regulatory protein n=1 Tax=Paraburkholderia sediminicola TaxID=458836 RepID=UPI0038BD18D1